MPGQIRRLKESVSCGNVHYVNAADLFLALALLDRAETILRTELGWGLKDRNDFLYDLDRAKGE